MVQEMEQANDNLELSIDQKKNRTQIKLKATQGLSTEEMDELETQLRKQFGIDQVPSQAGENLLDPTDDPLIPGGEIHGTSQGKDARNGNANGNADSGSPGNRGVAPSGDNGEGSGGGHGNSKK